MKKILLSLFIHLFVPYYVFSGGVLFMAGGIEDASCTCGTYISNCVASETTKDLYNVDYIGAKFPATSGQELCDIRIEIKVNNDSASQTLTIRVGTSADLTGESDAGTYVLGAGVTGDIFIELDIPRTLTTATWYFGVKSDNVTFADRISLEAGNGTACSSGLREIDNNGNGTWDMVDDGGTWDIEAGVRRCND